MLSQPVIAHGEAFNVSGFGTLGYARSSADDMSFLRDITQSGGNPWLVDSRLGLQLSYQPNQRLEIIGQLVSREQIRDSFDHTVLWAFAGWRPSDAWHLRLGRLGTDFFLHSDSSYVGYAAVWARPPVELYAQLAYANFDGFDVSYQTLQDDTRWQFKVQGGNTHATVMLAGQPYRLKANDTFSVMLAAESGYWRGRATVLHAKLGSELPAETAREAFGAIASATAPVFPAISQEAEQIRNMLFNRGRNVKRVGAALAYDDLTWFAQTELSQAWGDNDQPAFNHKAGYLMAGRRFGRLTPYVIYSAAFGKKVTAENDWSVLGPQAQGLQTTTIGFLNQGRTQQRTLSIGSRWEVNNQAALKLQWDHTVVAKEGAALWRNPNSEGGEFDQFSVVLDFIF